MMPVDKRNHYSGTYQNGITSERYYHKNINEVVLKKKNSTVVSIVKYLRADSPNYVFWVKV